MPGELVFAAQCSVSGVHCCRGRPRQMSWGNIEILASQIRLALGGRSLIRTGPAG